MGGQKWASYLICLHFVNHTFYIILEWSWEKLQNTAKNEKKCVEVIIKKDKK